jgi:hypothetical protein
METPKTRTPLHILLCILVFSIVFASLTELSVHSDWLLDRLMPIKDWVEFKVPHGAKRIRAAGKRVDQGIRICTEDEVGWSDVTVKITGKDKAIYIALAKLIAAGACEDVPFSDFAGPSWKRMSMPPKQPAAKIELLVTYKAKGYVSLQPQ